MRKCILMLEQERSRISRSALTMKASDIVKEGISAEAPSGWGTRHTIVVVAALGNLLGYFLRVDMSVAIVAMVDQSKRAIANTYTPKQ